MIPGVAVAENPSRARHFGVMRCRFCSTPWRQSTELQSSEMWQKNLTFHSALSAEAVLTTLARTTDEQRMSVFSFSGFEGKQPFLSKIEENKFRLRKRIFYRNSFARHLAARLAPRSDGTLMEAHFAMSIFVHVFMIFWFGFLALVEVVAVITTARALLTPGIQLGTNEYMLLLIPIAMLVFGWLLVSFGLYLSRNDERDIIGFVEQVLSARRLPDPSQPMHG